MLPPLPECPSPLQTNLAQISPPPGSLQYTNTCPQPAAELDIPVSGAPFSYCS